MAAYQRKKITISILIPFLICILFFTIMVWRKYRSSYDVPVTPPTQRAEGNRPVTLFFTASGVRLAREAREIDPCEDDNSCLKSVLDELLYGPVGEFGETLPEGTAVEAVHIEGNQATVEFNRTFFEAMPSGSSAEMLAVYSVVDTIGANFPRIQKVKIIANGTTEGRLRHLDLSEPLAPDYSLEQIPSSKPDNGSTETTTTRKGTVP